MKTMRIFSLAFIFTLSSSLTICTQYPQNPINDGIKTWQTTYLANITPARLQFIANYLDLLLANAIIEVKTRQFFTPIAQLTQQIRTNILAYNNTTEALATLTVLLEKLAYIVHARTISNQILHAYIEEYEKNQDLLINNALGAIQLHGQAIFHSWADEHLQEIQDCAAHSAEQITNSIPYFQGLAKLYTTIGQGVTPTELSQENKEDIPLMIIDTILQNNPIASTVAENMVISLNNTSDCSDQILLAAIELYKQYYMAVYDLITAPTVAPKYRTTLFGIYDEQNTPLPDADHVFEHMLHITTVYTQKELLSI